MRSVAMRGWRQKAARVIKTLLPPWLNCEALEATEGALNGVLAHGRLAIIGPHMGTPLAGHTWVPRWRATHGYPVGGPRMGTPLAGHAWVPRWRATHGYPVGGPRMGLCSRDCLRDINGALRM